MALAGRGVAVIAAPGLGPGRLAGTLLALVSCLCVRAVQRHPAPRPVARRHALAADGGDPVRGRLRASSSCSTAAPAALADQPPRPARLLGHGHRPDRLRPRRLHRRLAPPARRRPGAAGPDRGRAGAGLGLAGGRRGAGLLDPGRRHDGARRRRCCRRSPVRDALLPARPTDRMEVAA